MSILFNAALPDGVPSQLALSYLFIGGALLELETKILGTINPFLFALTMRLSFYKVADGLI